MIKSFYYSPRGAFYLIDFILLLLEVNLCSSIRITMLDIPSPTILGEAVELTCSYELDNDKLYSVKWYKDGVEFYRFVPNDWPPGQTLPIDGIKVDVSRSTAKGVYLKKVELESQGTYKCEVSTEAPEFKTAELEKDMEVIVLPQEGPSISKIKTRFNLDDIVYVNCTSAKSKPAPVLKWYINDNPAPVEYEYDYPTISYPDRLESSVKGLRFKVTELHLQGGLMNLKCTAALSSGYHIMSTWTVTAGGKKHLSPIMGTRIPKVESIPSCAIGSIDYNNILYSSVFICQLTWILMIIKIKQL
ncbi:uncharacterized protein LOC128395351 [Panonychus citri]|uniref:uncharacterized protein LOC128395351 n=1 Tax=Panonychus citri TaxID=50023 RepID=UPI002307D294|nr:uncharacterized protein LOC128395351 [Panonychus citri]